MGFELEIEQDATMISLSGRCVGLETDELKEALDQARNDTIELRIESDDLEAIDTSVMQLLIAAAQDWPSVKTKYSDILYLSMIRWGLAPELIKITS